MFYGGSGVGITGSANLTYNTTSSQVAFNAPVTSAGLNSISGSFNTGTTGGFTYFEFTSNATFSTSATVNAKYFALGGGGGGGYWFGGGGGAGGLRSNDSLLSGTILGSQFDSSGLLPLTAGTYSVTLGTAGTGAIIGSPTVNATGGTNTTLVNTTTSTTLVSANGGGLGGSISAAGGNGGCGGGVGNAQTSGAGTGNQGNGGGIGGGGDSFSNYAGGGGGGIITAGSRGAINGSSGGAGGAGLTYYANGVAYGGGGGGGVQSVAGNVAGTGGLGGGGDGGIRGTTVAANATSRGSGGGGSGSTNPPGTNGGNGSAGVLIVLIPTPGAPISTNFANIGLTGASNNMQISTTNGLNITGIPGPTGYASANVLNINSSGLVTYNNYIRGTVTANGMTPVSVSNSLVQANSIIVLNRNSTSATSTLPAFVSSVTPGTGFTIVNTALDSSTYNFLIQ